MNIGMLWYDNDPKSAIGAKIEKAAAYYRTKYGKDPNVCFIHPSMIPKDTTPGPESARNSSKIEVRTSSSVLPNHFWMGINGTVIPSES